MTAYATVADVEAGFRDLSEAEEATCSALLDEAGIIIDVYNVNADVDVKKLVSCKMVRRVLGVNAGDGSFFPMGTTQGSMAAGGYSQSWTMGSGGGSGELYLSSQEKRLLGVGNKIGSWSPVQELVPEVSADD